MNIMDISQISELATALIDSWTSASSQSVIPQTQSSDTQAGDTVNKTFGNSVTANILPISDNYYSNSTINVAGFPSNVMEVKTEPMEEYDDPLESFSWWDGETFYCNQDYETGCSVASDMQTEDEFSILPDFPLEDAMKREDLFQTKDVNILHNPTLAELNCSGEPIFDIENSFLSDDASFILNSDALSKSLPQTENQFINFSGMPSSNTFSQNVILPTNFTERRDMLQSSLSSSCPTSSRAMPCPQYLSISDEKFLLCPNNSPASDLFYMKRSELLNNKSVISPNTSDSTDSVFATNTLPATALLSSSAPPDVAASKSFPNVHVEKSVHLLEGINSYNTEKSPFEFSSLSLSNDEESGSYFDDTDDDDDEDYDFSSDEDYQYENSETFSTSWPPGSELKRSCHHRKHRYFWQYNLQSRGLKGQNLPQLPEICDPYVLNDAMDPVFAEECNLPVKHSGKARKGDGNDLTPNPHKLYNIGIELKKLNKLIYDLTPVNEIASDAKPLSRKEKNKLASRVCRLKKKAQHEANKIKLYGLQQEHRQLLTLLMEVKQLVKFKIGNFQESKDLSCIQKFESYVILHGGCQVAENTTEFVNKVLDRVAKGECNGGLGEM